MTVIVMIVPAECVKLDLLIGVSSYHLQTVFYKFPILDVVKCEYPISYPLGLVEQYFAFLICQQSFINTLLKLKFLSRLHQLGKYLSPILAS